MDREVCYVQFSHHGTEDERNDTIYALEDMGVDVNKNDSETFTVRCYREDAQDLIGTALDYGATVRGFVSDAWF